MKMKILSLLAITSVLLLGACQRNQVIPNPSDNSSSQQTSESGSQDTSDSSSQQTSDSTSSSSNDDSTYSHSYESEEAAAYYASISDTLSGSELRTALEELCYGSFKITPSSLSYSAVKKYFAGAYRSPKNSNDTVLYYTDKSGNNTSWNKEHIWPNSRGTGDGSGPCGDPWVIAPCDSSDNSGRGNNVYGLVSGSYDPGTGADGALLKYRGIASRAILYTATTWWHHPGKNSAPLDLNDSTTYTSGANKMGILSQLLEWNLQYPIDDTEVIRNEYIYKTLGVRNPFVDNRSFGCRIWGNYNDKTRVICAGQYDESGDQGDTAAKEDTPVTTPQTGHNYKMGMFQKALNQQLYITGEIANSYYGATTPTKSSGANVVLESATGGYYIKVKSQYLNVVTSGTHNNVSYSSSPTSIWTFNSTYQTFVTTTSNGEMFVGANKEYSTLSASSTSYLTSSTNYPAHLYEI